MCICGHGIVIRCDHNPDTTRTFILITSTSITSDTLLFASDVGSAGELTTEELERIVNILQNPRQYKIPDWMLNRQKDHKDGSYSQLLANVLDNNLREDLERLKKIRAHRGLRHYWGLRVRGQHTKTSGRRGKTMGVSKKK